MAVSRVKPDIKETKQNKTMFMEESVRFSLNVLQRFIGKFYT